MVDLADFCGRYIKSHYQLSDVKKYHHVSLIVVSCIGKMGILCLSFKVEKILEGRKSRN